MARRLLLAPPLLLALATEALVVEHPCCTNNLHVYVAGLLAGWLAG